MSDPPDYIPQKQPPSGQEKRYPPRRIWPKIEAGQDFATLTATHGRPHGVFEHGREKTYKGND